MIREVNGDPEEEVEFSSDYSDTESESSSSNSDSGSVSGSLNVHYEDDFNDENVADHLNDVTIEASCSSSTTTKTIPLDVGIDGTDDESELDVIDKMDNLNIATASAKNKSQIYEKLANEIPECSKETQDVIKKKLSGKKNPILCELCGEYMDGEAGIKIHKSRKHKN